MGGERGSFGLSLYPPMCSQQRVKDFRTVIYQEWCQISLCDK